ncbi:hypothetical protein B0H21DRAFT_748571 [Amylocystis lapponica]|nr:hypothetical protein B0H21DRAFT_748571 [Amylocystis lapponica]
MFGNLLAALPLDHNPLGITSQARILSINVGENVEIEASTAERITAKFTSTMTLAITKLGYDHNLDLPPVLLGELARAFSAAPITALRIRADTEMLGPESWLPAFQQWPDLRSLQLKYSEDLITPFELLGAPDPAAPDRLLCPQLGTLVIRGQWDSDSEEEEWGVVDTSAECLAFRKEKGSVLGLLRFEDTSGTLKISEVDAQLAACRSLVGSLEIDIIPPKVAEPPPV